MSEPHIPRPSIVIGRAGVVTLAVTLGLLCAAARFVPDRLEWADSRVADLVGSPRYIEFWRDVSQLGSTELTVVLAFAVSLVAWRRCRPLAVLYPTAVLLGLLVNFVLKVAIVRPRPPNALTDTSLGSFPSGHTIQAVIALGMLPPVVFALTGRRSVAFATMVLTAIGALGVGISRIVLGAHWPSDIIGGILVGVLILLAADFVLERFSTSWLPPCTGCPLHRAWGIAYQR